MRKTVLHSQKIDSVFRHYSIMLSLGFSSHFIQPINTAHFHKQYCYFMDLYKGQTHALIIRPLCIVGAR